MAIKPSPSIVTSSLLLCCDMGNKKSWRGFPTTNLNSLTSIGIYNNVPGHVTAALATTGETYLGAPVYKLTLTPTTATGVSYLTAGNNPGIGVVTGGGGGLANRYTGHSIFFRTTVPMHTNPIWTHYSNIGGWQSSANYDRTSDGWYRAYVTFYSASGGSDGKYWAINPATATLNTPIVIYWAAPFKEDSNVNTFVSPYVESTRSSTQAIVDLTGNTTLTASSLTYGTDGNFSFNGSSNYIDVGQTCTGLGITRSATFGGWIYPTSNSACYIISDYGTNGIGMTLRTNSNLSADFYVYPNNYRITYTYAFNPNTWYYLVGVADSTNMYMYLNGVQVGSAAMGNGIGTSSNTLKIGARGDTPAAMGTGIVSHVHVYGRALSASEVRQNFNALRGRYGL